MNINPKTYQEFEQSAVALIKEGNLKVLPADDANISTDVTKLKWGYLFSGSEKTKDIEGYMGTLVEIVIKDLKNSVDKDFLKKYLQSEKGRFALIDKWKEIAEREK